MSCVKFARQFSALYLAVNVQTMSTPAYLSCHIKDNVQALCSAVATQLSVDFPKRAFSSSAPATWSSAKNSYLLGTFKKVKGKVRLYYSAL